MTWTMLLPAAVGLLEFGAAIVYALDGRWAAAGVWFFYSLAAGFLTFLGEGAY